VVAVLEAVNLGQMKRSQRAGTVKDREQALYLVVNVI